MRFAGKLPYFRTKITSPAVARVRGLYALDALGALAFPATNQLSEMLRSSDSETRKMGILGLSSTGPVSTPYIIQAITHEDREVRSIAIHALRAIGASATSAVPALKLALRDSDPEIRCEVVITLGYLRDDPQAVVPLLTKSLQDVDYRCRMDAAVSLAEFPAQAKTAAPALRGALEDPHHWVRHQVAISLCRIAPESAPDALACLIRDLENEDPSVRKDAIETLATLETLAKPAVPYLINILRNSNLEFQESALLALAKIDPEQALKITRQKRSDHEPAEE
jgi:HEAT repeat protein